MRWPPSTSSTRWAASTSSRRTGSPPARASSSPPTADEAREAVRAYLSGEAFGDAGRTVVIEEGLTGPELSLLVLCDGARRRPAGPGPGLQADRRRRRRPQHRRDGRLLARPRWSSADLVEEVMAKAVAPTLDALGRLGARLPGRPLRRDHADPRRPQDPGVQRALRRPRMPGGGPPPRLRPGRPPGRGGGRARCPRRCAGATRRR